MKDANTQITHCYLTLQPFKVKVFHRPDAQMVVADLLSSGARGVICSSAAGEQCVQGVVLGEADPHS